MMIDESRKLVQVQAIIDATHFRASWRGQCYEATAVPDTSTLTVGDAVFCHFMPESTQLLALIPGKEVLWFTPGAPATTTRGELWKCLDGTNAAYVLSCPNDDEQITLLWWTFGKLWMATWDTTTTRVYTVDRSAATATLRASWIVGLGAGVNPVVGAATFGTYMYLQCGSRNNYPEVYVRRMNPVTYATTVVFTYVEWLAGYSGGIVLANDGGTPRLVGSSGVDTDYSDDGVTWALDTDINTTLGTFDTFGMLADTRTGLVFMGAQRNVPVEQRVLRRDSIGNWVQENVGVSASGMNQGVALCQQIVGGVSAAIWLQTWGWRDNPGVYWRDYDTGVWTYDWDGPCAATGYTDEWLGSYSQGIVGWRSTVFGLWYKYWGPALSELFRRDAPGVWTSLVHASWAGYVAANTLAGSTLAMCVVR